MPPRIEIIKDHIMVMTAPMSVHMSCINRDAETPSDRERTEGALTRTPPVIARVAV